MILPGLTLHRTSPFNRIPISVFEVQFQKRKARKYDNSNTDEELSPGFQPSSVHKGVDHNTKSHRVAKKSKKKRAKKEVEHFRFRIKSSFGIEKSLRGLEMTDVGLFPSLLPTAPRRSSATSVALPLQIKWKLPLSSVLRTSRVQIFVFHSPDCPSVI